MSKQGWTFQKARFRPLVGRIKLFFYLQKTTNRRNGPLLHRLWTNFKLATWLATPSDETNN